MAALPPPPPVRDIIVTASKQDIPLSDYAGSVSILTLDRDQMAREGAQGTAAIVDRLPAMASTHLGPGRDKLFVRGVAEFQFQRIEPGDGRPISRRGPADL